MIPKGYITEWAQNVPWQANEQIEQDLVIARALIELFSDEELASKLAFRGGTALHKLYLNPQPRYSEDIDLVQITAEPFGKIVNRIRERLAFLDEPKRRPKAHNFTLYYRFASEFPPSVNLQLKVETNTREHFSVLGFVRVPFAVESSWFTGSCKLTTYRLEELLATKLRALYQRKKGRDLFDLSVALTQSTHLDHDAVLHTFREYMRFSVGEPPTRQAFIENLDAKMNDTQFLGDTIALLRLHTFYNPQEAYELVRNVLIERI